MNKNIRITMNQTVPQMLMALSEGNPGALNVLMGLLSPANDGIDPDSDPDSAFGGGFASMFCLDSIGVYGPSIWILYKDICMGSIPQVMAVLRADQLGQLADVTSELILKATEDRYPNPETEVLAQKVRTGEVMDAVRKVLPDFNKQV